MANVDEVPSALKEPSGRNWLALAKRVLDGHRLDRHEALAILRADDEQLLELLAAAYQVRLRHHGRRVHLNFLINAKSGLCGEDCGYCAQSRMATAEVPQYDLLDPETILDGARLAAERRSKTYCAAISGLRPSEKDLAALAEIVPQIKARFRLRVCISPGLLDDRQAARLKAAGVDRINHNLNTLTMVYLSVYWRQDLFTFLITLIVNTNRLILLKTC